jgi:hypothetical protein
MTQEDYRHPIAPPPELVQRLLQLCDTHEHPGWHWKTRDPAVALLKEACQYGADQELEAFCEWLREAKNHGLGYEYGQELADRYRAALAQSKPPSLKEQALEILRKHVDRGYLTDESSADADTIRRALETLPE